MTKFNAEFFDHYTQDIEKIDESNEYKAMGYASDQSAGARYNKIHEIITSHTVNKKEISILDVGAGTGAMWKQVWDSQSFLLKKINHLTLLEPYDKYLELLRSRVKHFDESHCDIVNDNLSNYYNSMRYSSRTYDVTLSCGALNYYDTAGAIEFIKQMAKLTSYGGLIIVESNIMTPNTPWSPGNFNPSFETMHSAFNSICSEFDVKVFRNYTTIWSGIVTK